MADSGAPVEELARAKVNLDLHVVGKRADGYHELDSLTAFAQIGDHVVLREHDRLELALTGPFADALEGDLDNLVLCAAQRLAALADRDPLVHIQLDKQLPVAAGLGGGSADAAATLRGLNRVWQLGMTTRDLAALGAELGADVPVCITGRSARMRGVGERVEPWDGLPPLAILLVNPRLPLSTAAVFKRFSLRAGPAARTWPPPSDLEGFATWLRASANHLEEPAGQLLPRVREVIAHLERQAGCLLARMSGSGATCFGLFSNPKDCALAAAAIGRAQSTWWLAASELR